MKNTEKKMAASTEMVFILDKSGSMSGLESDTIGGFNTMIEKQKKLEGACFVTTVLFSTETEFLHDRVDLQEIQPLTEADYAPMGCTALFDAIGSTVNHISRIHRYVRKEDVPQKCVFVIMTDGNYTRIRTITIIRKQLQDGTILYIKVSKGSGEIHSKMWARIRNQQLHVTQEYFNSKI